VARAPITRGFVSPSAQTPGCASGRSVAASFAETSGARLALHALLAALLGARAELPVGRHTSAHVLRTVLLALLAACLATATRWPTLKALDKRIADMKVLRGAHARRCTHTRTTRSRAHGTTHGAARLRGRGTRDAAL
jgi:hypothetical protein